MVLFLFLLLIGIVEGSACDSHMQDVLGELRTLKKVVEKLTRENDEMRRRLNDHDDILQSSGLNEKTLTEMRKKRLLAPSAPDVQNPVVAFTAVLTKDFALGQHQTIEYDKVLTNFGNAYDPMHGHFTTPVHGIYLISASSTSLESAIRTEIVRNGVQIAATYGDDYDIGSHTIVVELESKDSVWVRNMDARDATVHSGPDRYYSSFSVMLMQVLS